MMRMVTIIPMNVQIRSLGASKTSAMLFITRFMPTKPRGPPMTSMFSMALLTM